MSETHCKNNNKIFNANAGFISAENRALAFSNAIPEIPVYSIMNKNRSSFFTSLYRKQFDDFAKACIDTSSLKRELRMLNNNSGDF